LVNNGVVVVDRADVDMTGIFLHHVSGIELFMLYLVALGWMYVVLLMTVAEALAPSGSLLGAAITFIFYGLLPLSIVLYLVGTPARRRALRAAEALQRSAAQPDGDRHPPRDAVAPKREEA
jgi:membrane protein implicated in regulation of membrane protease activity